MLKVVSYDTNWKVSNAGVELHCPIAIPASEEDYVVVWSAGNEIQTLDEVWKWASNAYNRIKKVTIYMYFH